jgi:triphosphoribosyl-dephospho-CoA synthase
MNSSRIAFLDRLARSLTQGAALELYLTPKPGLVDLADNGSHPDLSLMAMEKSIRIVAVLLDEVAGSLVRGEPFPRQRDAGLRAERRMFGELRTNTHKGYIFLSAMLMIASWHAPSRSEGDLRRTLSALAVKFFSSGEQPASHGRGARERYGTGGIVREAVLGLPSLFDDALPAFRAAKRRHRSFNAASFAMLARLMQVVDDTTTLHRGGPPGLERVKRDGRRLEALIDAGGDYGAFLRQANRDYIRMNLTMGGIADLLALGYGYLLARDAISAGLLEVADWFVLLDASPA